MRPTRSARTMLLAMALAGLPVLLGACGATRSTLPPKPTGAQGFVPLRRLAGAPEVYAQAQVSTIGVVTAARHHHSFRLTGPGVHVHIALDPVRLAAPLAGQRVRASGIFTVSFQAGYELLLSSIARDGENEHPRR